MGKVEFGKFMNKLRNNAGLSLREFARQADLSPTYISKMERGDFSPPSADTIKRMAEVLKYPEIDKLLTLADKIDEELEDMIKNNPVVPAFLRSVSPKEMQKIMDDIKKERERKK